MQLAARLASLAATLTFAGAAAAQDLQLGPALNLGTLGVTVATGEATRQMFGKHSGRASASSARTKKAAASLAYRPSAAVRKRVVDAFVRDVNKNDAAGAREMRALFAREDPIVSVGKDVAKLGLRRDNLATGMGVYLVQCWYGARGKTASRPAEYQAVFRQAAEVFGSMPALARASDATKQEAAEALLLYGALFEEAVKSAKKTQPAMIPRLQAAIAAHAKSSLGFDLAKLRLGADGFY